MIEALKGDIVIVHTLDDRDLKCEVIAAYLTTVGPKLKVQSGSLLFVVNPDQVTHILKAGAK